MLVEDCCGSSDIKDTVELEKRLESIREIKFGAFILSHDGQFPELWVHFNEELAFLHWFLDPDECHPGFNAIDMTPVGCPESVFFLQVGGVVADGFEVPSDSVVTSTKAIEAAKEFFLTNERPSCIRWVEL